MKEQELLKKINGKLQEIDSKINKPTFHISGGEGNIGQQNNFYTQTSFKKLTIQKNNPLQISANKIIYSRDSLLSAFLAALIFAFISPFFFSYFFSFYFSDMYFSNIPILNYLIFTFLIFIFIYSISILSIFLAHINSLLVVTLSFNKISCNNKILFFNEIRSVLKINEKIGYSIYIYKKDEIMPILSFNLKTIHEANAVFELLISNINYDLGAK